MLNLYKQKCQGQAVYICLTEIGQEICVVLFDDSDNENYEKDNVYKLYCWDRWCFFDDS